MKSKVKIQIAREFRKNPTRSERIMWNVLRGNNFLDLGFRRQHIIDGYIVDFYCHKLKLAIEIDGGVHQNQIKEDIERQKIIEERGIKFFRVNSKEVEENLQGVLKEIELFIAPTPTLPH